MLEKILSVFSLIALIKRGLGCVLVLVIMTFGMLSSCVGMLASARIAEAESAEQFARSAADSQTGDGVQYAEDLTTEGSGETFSSGYDGYDARMEEMREEREERERDQERERAIREMEYRNSRYSGY